MSLLASNELTPEELDAMEAAALPEQSPFPSPAPRGPAMGPIQQLDPASEYSPEELEVYQQKTELSPDDLDEQLVTSVFDDPTYIPTREEYFTARDAKARLKAEGKLPGLLEDAATGATGFIQTLGDMGHEILDDPGEFFARGPATGKAIAKKSWRNTNDVARWIRTANRVDPIGRDEGSGEFIFGQIGAGRPDADVLANAQAAALAEGKKIRPVTEEDIKDYEYDFFLGERTRQKELEEWVAATTDRTHPLVRLFSERDQMEQPMQATSDIAGGLFEATNVATMGIPLGAGAKTLGFSRAAKAGGSRAARVLEKAAQTGIEGMETGATRFQNLIQKTTRLTPETQTKIAKWSAAGGVGGAALGLESQIPGVAQVQDAAKVIGGAYVGYKLGLGTLRTVQKVAGPTATILRVAADPADGFDAIAQASVATKLGAFPELSPVREVLENPTKFRSIESTPARLAADPRLGPQTRAVMEGLANPLVVQGVRGASAVAGGAVKGAAANTPFVALAMNAEEDKAAGAMLGIGGAFGAAGGAISRLGGVRQRRAEARASDIGRMFMDVELAGGDVAGLAKTYSPQQLGDMAAMQGIFRNRVEFVPLAQADYDLNVQANGGAGSAGLFVQAPPGEKARVFVNLDARRDGIAPHEFGHALLSSGALGGAQAAEIRANVNRRYTQAGVEVRANEYARNLIAAQNEKAFPSQNLPISQDAINAKLDELGQSGLLRGDLDTLDWARDELFAEEFRTASANLDFSAIRRGMPADGSWLGSMEKVLGGHANALSISGVRIDPATGAPIDTPQSLFRDNPILAADKTLLKNLDTYIKNYRQWVNHPDQSKPRGVRVAPTARPQDLANNPQVTFHDLGNGVRGNDFAILDPATGQPMLRSQADINAETIKRQQQMRSLVGSKLLPATDPNLGPKKTADGRVTIRGRVLPQQFDFLNGFAQHIRGFGRQFEQHAARGESMQVRYHAIGSGDTGAFRIKNLGNLEAITREVIPWGWELTSKGNLMASMLDLTQFRNRALRAINQADPQMQFLFGNDMAQVEGTLKQWMDNHRQDLPGDNKIGSQKRDAINALVGIATNINRNANPFSGKIGGPGSAIKQFRLDRVDTAAGTGRQGFHFDYDKANGNLLPEVATPLPDLSRDLPGQAMPERIAATAVIDKDGKILSSPLKTHAQLMEESLFNLDKGEFPPTKNFGFVTTEGRFVLQSEAQQIAQQSRQVQGNQPISGEIVSGLEREGLLNPVTDPLDKPVAELNKIMREVGDKMDAGLKLQSYELRDDLPEFQTQAIDDPADFADYVVNNLAPQFPKEFQDRIKSAAKNIRTPQGQAMPDVVHSTGYTLPKKVPQRGYFLVGAKSSAGHSMEYKVDPNLVVQPPVKDISKYKGESVIVLEADRYDTTNGRMGGPLHPFLLSNQVVARTPSGEGYKAVWANMTSTFVSGTRNKVMNNTDNGRALIQLMASDAHRSNRDFLNNYMAKVDAIKNSLSKQEVDALHVLLELGARQVQESKLPKPQMDFLKAMATAKSQATRGKNDNAKRLFSAAISKYGRTKWFQEISQNMASVSFVAEAANFTFQQRASAIDKVNGMHFLPSVEKDLKASEDFAGAKNLDVVASIQLSKNPDAFAVYFGKNKSEEGKMTNTERKLRDQFLSDPKFKVHPSYDWMMLSPENADNFLLDKPADLETLFPWYRQAHPKDSVRNGTKETVAGAIKRYSGINLKL